jgi:hypothetical protein
MTEDAERKYFGSDALFIYDKDNRENDPVRGVHTNVIHPLAIVYITTQRCIYRSF